MCSRTKPTGRSGWSVWAAYLETRAKDREGTLRDESPKALRRGWYLGDDSFRDKVLSALDGAVSAKRR